MDPTVVRLAELCRVDGNAKLSIIVPLLLTPLYAVYSMKGVGQIPQDRGPFYHDLKYSLANIS
jgi:hypothetical protein